MEKLLAIWDDSQCERRVSLSTAIIKSKALSIFGTLANSPNFETCDLNFNASNGWFQRFKSRANLRNVTLSAKAASADLKSAEEFLHTFARIIVSGSYSRHRVFNVDETGLF